MGTESEEIVDLDRVDTVYLLGAGCVAGAWPLVLRATGRFAESTLDQDELTWWMTATTQYLHFFARWKSLEDAQLERRFGEGDHSRTRDNLAAQMESDGRKHWELQKAIADEFHAAHDRNELSLKEPILELLAVHAGEGSTAILTTNWDLCIEKLLGENAKVIHLHLGGHFKTGHPWTGQNRPPELAAETG